MGDRFVVGFREDKTSEPIWLYSHWSGERRTQLIARAIQAARPRWNDAAYATRIAISSIVGPAWDGEHGFGISAGGRNFTLPDYNDVHLVTWSDRTVIVQDIDGEREFVDFGFETFIYTELYEPAR
jgi:hypothetical protein